MQGDCCRKCDTITKAKFMLIESAGGKEYVDIMVFGDMKEIGEEIGGD